MIRFPSRFIIRSLLRHKKGVNNEKYTKGEIIEVTAARFNEIIKKDRFVEAYEETTEKKAN